MVVGATLERAPFLVCGFLLAGKGLCGAMKLGFVLDELGALAAACTGDFGLPTQRLTADALLVSV